MKHDPIYPYTYTHVLSVSISFKSLIKYSNPISTFSVQKEIDDEQNMQPSHASKIRRNKQQRVN